MEPTAQPNVSRNLDSDVAHAPLPKIGVVIQGPIQSNLNGHSTRDVLESLQQSRYRDRLFVLYAAWEDEPAHLLDAVAGLVDQLVLCQKPDRAGSCHRNFQAHAVSSGLRELERREIKWAVKTRGDLVLSDRFIERLLERTLQADYKRLLVTNLLTRYEPYHISDLVVFSSTENLRCWFDPVPVFYEDLYSPEVQFARVFIRSRGLAYPMTLDHYFRFLRDWVELTDFYDEGLFWFKDGCGSIRTHNRINYIMYDRDAGPILTQLMSVQFHQFLQRRSLGLNLLATAFLVADALKRYFVVTMPPPFRHFRRYTVDPKASEHSKPVAGPRTETSKEVEVSEVLVEEPVTVYQESHVAKSHSR